MNQIATHRRLVAKPPSIVAKLNLENEDQRRLHDFIRRMHTGRWPTLRAHGMRQVNGVIIEAAEWLRVAGSRYSLIEWRPDGNGWASIPFTTRRAVLAALRAAR